MTEMGFCIMDIVSEEKNTIEEIPIDYLLHDVLILKAECLRDRKLLGYCEYLEKQLFKVKNGEAKIIR